MRIRDCLRRLWPRREQSEPELVEEAIAEHAQRFDAKPSPAQPPDILPPVLDYIADMLSDRRLVPSYLRTEMAAARKLPGIAWELARKDRAESLPELLGIRNAALEHAMRVSTAVLKAQQGKWRL